MSLPIPLSLILDKIFLGNDLNLYSRLLVALQCCWLQVFFMWAASGFWWDTYLCQYFSTFLPIKSTLCDYNVPTFSTIFPPQSLNLCCHFTLVLYIGVIPFGFGSSGSYTPILNRIPHRLINGTKKSMYTYFPKSIVTPIKVERSIKELRSIHLTWGLESH